MVMRLLLAFIIGWLAAPLRAAEQVNIAATAINSLGIDLLTKTTQPNQNALLSSYSIQAALAMTYAGAAGATRAEMAQTLYFPKDENALHDSFWLLAWQLRAITDQSAKYAAQIKKTGGQSTPISINVANRLFGQTDYQFQPEFLDVLKSKYAAGLDSVNFAKNPATATERINAWVAKQTQDRIRNIISTGDVTELMRLVLVNAIYFRAPWSSEFKEAATKPQDFQTGDKTKIKVPTMYQQHGFGYARRDGFVVVVLPYRDPRLQFVILLPDRTNTLAAVEKKLSPQLLAECAEVDAAELKLYLPRFKFEPPSLALSQGLKGLGMKSAFSDSANFSRMTASTKSAPLRLSEVFHKTFFSLNERETEAAAATAITATQIGGRVVYGNLIEVRVDRPFLFAVQHRDTGACIFLGRLVNPN